MNTKKNGNLAKLVAFFLIVIVLIAAIAFSASGWQGDDQTQPDSGKSDEDNNSSNGNTDENTDGNQETPTLPEKPETPVYKHYITGLEISEEESLIKPICIVYDTNAPMYGTSSAFMCVELPTENGATRLLGFTADHTTLGKIGSIAPTRKYISNIAKYFGAVIASDGNDDSFGYSGFEPSDGFIDFSLHNGFHYEEFERYAYTNADLISAYIKNKNISTIRSDEVSVPYKFAESDFANGSLSAGTVMITFDKSSTTELTYNSASDKYTLKKNAVALTDRLNDKALSYDNVFVLFADSVTHETADATELILDTVSGGCGYYANGGKAQTITWAVSEDGSLVFFDESGARLAIAPGTSYISFVKSSLSSETKLI